MPYLVMSEVASSDDSGRDGIEERRVEKKGFTKASFKEPMEKLSTALCTLCSTLENGHENCLVVNKILTQYNVLAEMTNHGKQVEKMQHQTDDGSEKGDDAEGRSSPSSDSSDSSSSGKSNKSNRLDDDKDISHHDENGEDEEEDELEGNVVEKVDEKEGEERVEQNDSRSSDSEKASHISNDQQSVEHGQENTAQQQQVQRITQAKNDTSDSERSSSANIPADNCANSDFSHKGIVAYVRSLFNNGVTPGGMAGKDIQEVLGLVEAPDLRILNQRKLFFSIKSNQMREVRQLYTRNDTLCDKKWIKELVLYLLELKKRIGLTVSSTWQKEQKWTTIYYSFGNKMNSFTQCL